MHIIKVGIDYRISPVEIREKLTFSNNEAPGAMQCLSRQDHVLENVIVSTCNRTDVYAVVDNINTGMTSIQQFLMEWFDTDNEQITPYLQHQQDDDAIRHLYRTAVGLDSMVLGETQILGQVRDAFFMSQDVKATDKILNELFKRVITYAKRAHSNTVISEQAVSVSYVAVELSKKHFGHIDNKQAAILGAGDMGELTLKNLKGSGVEEITVISRTLKTAEQLASKFDAKAVQIEHMQDALKDIDILITSTAADEVVLTGQSMQSLQQQRNERPLCIIDIAVPRDVDRSAKDVDGVFVYDIDDLYAVVDKNMQSRKQAADRIETQLDAELSAFNNWVAMLDAVPIIKALNEKSMSIQEKTLNSIYRKIPDLTEREMKVLQKHTKSIVHQLMEEPIKRAKAMGENQEDEQKMELFKEIFGLDSHDKRKVNTHDRLLFPGNYRDWEYTYK